MRNFNKYNSSRYLIFFLMIGCLVGCDFRLPAFAPSVERKLLAGLDKYSNPTEPVLAENQSPVDQVATGSDEYDASIGIGVDIRGRPMLARHVKAKSIYWNPDHKNASDKNEGTDPNRPKATLSNAWTELRDGTGDWLLLAQGAKSRNGFGVLQPRNGLSAQYPIVVTTYDSAAPYDFARMRRGIVTVGTDLEQGQDMMHISSRTANRAVFENIAFDKRSSSESTVMVLGPTRRDLMFYNVRFYRTQVAVQGDHAGTPTDRLASDIVFRRCVFSHGYAGRGHSQGLYLWATDRVVVEDSIFYHNGWQGTDRDNATEPPNIFKHNAYFGTLTFNTVFRRNVSAHASSHGLQLRGGGTVVDNVFANNPLNLHVGGGDEYTKFRPNGIPYKIINNVVIGSSDIDRNTPRGTGVAFSNTQKDGVASGNIVANIGKLRTKHNQFGLQAVAALNAPTHLNWTNNILWNWGTGSLNEERGAFPSQVEVRLSGNVLPNERETGGNQKAPSRPFPDPTRDILSFARSQGFADENLFWDFVAHNPERDWAREIGDYVRAGFLQ